MLIKCKHKNDLGKVCGNVMGVVDGRTLTITKNGRKIEIILLEKYPTRIMCEKCKGTTLIYPEKKKEVQN